MTDMSYSGAINCYVMCKDGASFEHGSVYEILVYQSVLDEDAINAVGYYLQEKWGISGDYRALNQGTVIRFQ